MRYEKHSYEAQSAAGRIKQSLVNYSERAGERAAEFLGKLPFAIAREKCYNTSVA